MTNDIGRLIISYFRDFQKLNRFIVVDGTLDISLAALHTLIEVDAQPGLSIGRLAQILDMPRTSVATIVGGLRRRRLLSNKQSKDDLRFHALYVTQTGANYLRADDGIAESKLIWLLAPLLPEQQDMLRELFRAIADGSLIADCPARAEEHPIRKELRRSTRALRLIHSDFFGSGMGSPEWQLLNTVLMHKDPPSISQISQELQIPLSSATTIVARLKKRGFITASQDSIDKRISRISAGANARLFCAQIEAQMAAKVSQAVKQVDQDTLKSQLEAFSLVVTDRRLE